MGKALDPLMVRPNGNIGGAFAETAAIASGVNLNQLVPLAGAVRGRFRFKASAAGTLQFQFARPGSTVAAPLLYTDTVKKPADIVVTANVESVYDLDHYGEDYIYITYVPSGNGSVTYADFSRV